MTIGKKLLTLAAPLALLAVGGCATGLPTQVSRFQALPAPAGQTFYVQPADRAQAGGLEFGQYAGLVRRNLIAQGFAEAASPAQASLIVIMDYGVDNGRERVVSTPGGFGGGFGGWGRPGFSRFGYLGARRSPFFWGWYDPFFDPWGGPDIRSYTVYQSYLTLDIRRTADNQAVFEGRAQAQSGTNQLQALVPNLVEAMFTNFPGNNGETVRITVPNEPRQRTRR